METSPTVLTGVKKRQQIDNANKTVFIWVALASVIVAVAVVLSQYMIKEFMYNSKVLGKLGETNSTLEKNIKTYDTLKVEVNNLVSNGELSRLRTSTNDVALQTIIDAMPTVDDRVAFATSFQQSILPRSGVSIRSFSAATLTAGPGGVPASGTNAGESAFSFEVSGNYDQIKKLFDDLQNSIRLISVQSLKLSGDGNNLTAKIEAKTFYAPAVTTALKEEKITR